jgi:hypothetical protein
MSAVSACDVWLEAGFVNLGLVALEPVALGAIVLKPGALQLAGATRLS